MQRRIATVSNLMAMLMVMLTSVVPHHHHQTIACFVKEVCVEDGCCNDRHTAHSDTDPEENESHCVAHEEYFQADDLRLDSVGQSPSRLPLSSGPWTSVTGPSTLPAWE